MFLLSLLIDPLELPQIGDEDKQDFRGKTRFPGFLDLNITWKKKSKNWNHHRKSKKIIKWHVRKDTINQELTGINKYLSL